MSQEAHAQGGGHHEKERPEQPNNSDFKQLRLTAFKPTYSGPFLIACCFIGAILLLPPGVAVVLASERIFEVEVQYDHIKRCTYNNHDSLRTFSFNGTTYSQGCRTRRYFTIPRNWDPPIYMYYKISGFYQNYREYVDSRSDLQIRGDKVLAADMPKCAPLLYPGTMGATRNERLTVNGVNLSFSNMVYNPCGAIAWSKFNDSLSIWYSTSDTNDITVTNLPGTQFTPMCRGGLFDDAGNPQPGSGYCHKKGIALSIDTSSRFGPAYDDITQWTGKVANSSNLYRANGYYYGEVGHKVPNATDEDYIVWARPAAMPTFLKLYRVIDAPLVAGSYVLDVEEFFDVTKFNGEKSLVLSTRSWIGTKNFALGGLMIAFGSLSLVNALAFFLISTLKKPTR